MNALRKEVQFLRLALDDFESTYVEGTVSTAALEDFKATVDRVRTSVLAMLTATDTAEYMNFIRKYRLRRAAVVCQSVLSGLVEGTIDGRTDGLEALEATVNETLECLWRVDGGLDD